MLRRLLRRLVSSTATRLPLLVLVDSSMDNEIDRLRRENEVLRHRLAQVTASRPLLPEAEPTNRPSHPDAQWQSGQHELTSDQIRRYSRQLLLPSFGIQGKSALCFGCSSNSDLQPQITCLICSAGAVDQ